MTTPRTLAMAAAITLIGVCTPVAASVLAADVAPRGIWHYLGNDAKLAHANPEAPDHGWGHGLRALLDETTPAEDRLDKALESWRALADEGDWRSARAACRFATVFRIGFRTARGGRGGPSWYPSERVRYCGMVPDDPAWSVATEHSGALWQDCESQARLGPKYKRKAAHKRCYVEYMDRMDTISRTVPSAHALMGGRYWHRRQVRKARTSWQAAIDGGFSPAMVSLAFAQPIDDPKDRARHAPPIIIRLLMGMRAAHEPKEAERWTKRLPLLLKAAETGVERSMFHYAQAQLALIAAEHGEILWNHKKPGLNRRFPLTPAEMAIGASLLRGIPDTSKPEVVERLQAGVDRRVEAMAWLAIVVGWTEPGEQLAGAGIQKAAFAHQFAEPILEVLEELSSEDELADAASRRNQLLPILGPGLTTWEY